MSNQLQDFYKATISQDWSIGTGNFYVSVKPTTAPGRLVISPSSDTLREIVEYSTTGTDANGDYIVITTRGVGSTTEQTHTVGEKVRMNITAEDWEDMRDDIDSIVAAGAANASISTRGIVQIATDAEFEAGTDTGSTTALLVATPSQIKTKFDNILYTELIAGEDIIENNALVTVSGEDTTSFNILASASNNATNSYEGQTFLMPRDGKITNVTIDMGSGSGEMPYMTMAIYATSGGLPTGSPLAISASVQVSSTYTFTIPSCPLLIAGVTYALVTHITVAGSFYPTYETSSSYANGNRVYSSDGSSWSGNGSQEMSFSAITYKIGDAGKIYKSNATLAGLSSYFVGIAKNTVSKGSNVKIQTGDVIIGLTGMTAGKTVYLSDTPGALSMSAGTVSRKVGLALSPTQLLIKHDNI